MSSCYVECCQLKQGNKFWPNDETLVRTSPGLLSCWLHFIQPVFLPEYAFVFAFAFSFLLLSLPFPYKTVIFILMSFPPYTQCLFKGLLLLGLFCLSNILGTFSLAGFSPASVVFFWSHFIILYIYISRL